MAAKAGPRHPRPDRSVPAPVAAARLTSDAQAHGLVLDGTPMRPSSQTLRKSSGLPDLSIRLALLGVIPNVRWNRALKWL
jgi:hypothetical protein